jgi:hypothetical protein
MSISDHSLASLMSSRSISRTFCAANLDCVSGSLISRSTIARLDVLAPFEVADQTGWL